MQGSAAVKAPLWWARCAPGSPGEGEWLRDRKAALGHPGLIVPPGSLRCEASSDPFQAQLGVDRSSLQTV